MTASDHLSDVQFTHKVILPGKAEGITASRAGRAVGYLDWHSDAKPGPRVQGVHVDAAHRRQGIAAEMYRRASEIAGKPLGHSEERTPAGDAFARSVGGHLPSPGDDGW